MYQRVGKRNPEVGVFFRRSDLWLDCSKLNYLAFCFLICLPNSLRASDWDSKRAASKLAFSPRKASPPRLPAIP